MADAARRPAVGQAASKADPAHSSQVLLCLVVPAEITEPLALPCSHQHQRQDARYRSQEPL